jgi:DtxR family Mn-dependent transcriptional regulator
LKSFTISASLQDYLETILDLEDLDKNVRVTDIAKKLNFAKASVNQTICKLVDLGYVTHQLYGPVLLTESGRQLAIKVKERHKKLRKFLIDVLDVNADIAEKDACLMEHVVSPETMDKLTYFLCKNGYITDGCEIYNKDE